MVLSVEAGSVARGILLLLSSPFVLFLYKLISESAAIKLLIYISTVGIPFSRISRVCKDILPRYYADDVREESWRVFRQCGGKRVVVTANPTVLVESFVTKWLRGDLVIGTELEVRDGIATGWVEEPGVVVGSKKMDGVLREFGESALPDLGLGDRESDHDFMGLCKEAYMVNPDPSAMKPSPEDLKTTDIATDATSIVVGFDDCFFKSRPEPLTALLTFINLPFRTFTTLFQSPRPMDLSPKKDGPISPMRKKDE